MNEPRKILYVEDEPDIQEITKIALESLGGFELLVCSSGSEAIEKGASFRADLLLLDVMMPGMDGPETLRQLRKIPELKNTPAIFMTAKVQPSEIEEYLAKGAIAVIPKPFEPMKLAKDIKAIWQNYYKG